MGREDDDVVGLDAAERVTEVCEAKHSSTQTIYKVHEQRPVQITRPVSIVRSINFTVEHTCNVLYSKNTA